MTSIPILGFSCIGLYLAVVWGCAHFLSKDEEPKEPVITFRIARHAIPKSMEQEIYAELVRQWIEGEEQWLKYSLIVPRENTVSWNL